VKILAFASLLVLFIPFSKIHAEELYIKGKVILNNSTKVFTKVIKGTIPDSYSLVSDDESLIIEIKNIPSSKKDYHLNGTIYQYQNQVKGEEVNNFEIIHHKNKEAIFEMMNTEGDLTEFSITRI
jgi:hypothetical protein